MKRTWKPEFVQMRLKKSLRKYVYYVSLFKLCHLLISTSNTGCRRPTGSKYEDHAKPVIRLYEALWARINAGKLHDGSKIQQHVPRMWRRLTWLDKVPFIL